MLLWMTKHMTIDNKQYLPAPSNSIKGKLAEMKAWAAYRHWYRRLFKLIKNKHFIVLECGCGPGFLSKLIQKWFPNVDVYVSDFEYTLVERAKQELSSNNIFQADAHKLPVRSETIDVLVSFHMIEHLAQPKLFLENSFRILKPGGYLIYASPNPNGIPAKIMQNKWSAIRPDHISLLSPDDWQELTTSTGFKLIEHGTTALSGIPIFKIFPINIVNQGLLFIFGFFPWMKGEAYIGIYQKPNIANTNETNKVTVNLSLHKENIKNKKQDIFSILCCPETNQPLTIAKFEEVNYCNKIIEKRQISNQSNCLVREPLVQALVRNDGKVLYPFKNGIPILITEESIICEKD